MTPLNAPITKSDLILERLTALHPKSIDLSLDRMWRLLRVTGDPHRKLPPVVHVAGTNGKGSVIAYMRAMLEAAGYQAHVSTSPHLVRFAERVRLAGSIIDEAYWAEVLERCEQLNGDAPVTFFEVTTAAAFMAFAETPADVLLLETGLGGRLDATNVIDRPAQTIITPISIDHTQYLGNTLAKIAAEKAGILRTGVDAIVSRQLPEPAQVFERESTRLGAPLIRHGIDWQAHDDGPHLRFTGFDADLTLPRPGLAGQHQIDNAGTAIAAIRNLAGFEVSDHAIADGLTAVDWPARLQRLTGGPLVAQAPDGTEIWLDGGHNAAAAVAVADTMAGLARRDPDKRPLSMIVGMLNSKDPAEFLKPFRGLADSIFATAIPQEAATWEAQYIVDAGRRIGMEVSAAATPMSAMAALRQHYEGSVAPRILICGSLHFAGRVLADNH